MQQFICANSFEHYHVIYLFIYAMLDIMQAIINSQKGESAVMCVVFLK